MFLSSTHFMDLTDCCIGQGRCPCGRPPTAELVNLPPTFGEFLEAEFDRISRMSLRERYAGLIEAGFDIKPPQSGSRLPISLFTDRC